MESDGFQIVTRRDGRKPNKLNRPEVGISPTEHEEKEWTEGAVNEIVKRIWECQIEIQQSTFYENFVVSLNKSLTALDEADPSVVVPRTSFQLDSIVCYGLGNFSNCIIARFQLALLLCMKAAFRAVVYVFDPIFLACEKEILTSLDICVLDKNEEGKRRVASRTLFYLPHCGKALYNNLLWANWGSPCLSHIVIIGNSFTRVCETFSNAMLKARWPYLFRSVSHIEEFCIKNNFRFKDIFNDLAIHVFPEDKVCRYPMDYWEDCDEPIYDSSEVEIVTNEMMKHFDGST